MEVTIMKIAKQMNAEYWAVSSKTGKNINNLFFRIAAFCFDDSMKREIELREKEVAIGTKLICTLLILINLFIDYFFFTFWLMHKFFSFREK